MKRTIAIFTLLMITFSIFGFTCKTYATEVVTNKTTNSVNTTNATNVLDKVNSSESNYLSEKAIDDETEGKIVEIKESQTKSLQDYKDKYGSDAYGLVAYILNIVRIYSIPFCFLGIAIGAIHKYIIGVRKLDTLQKGAGLIVTFVTLLIICQVLPLAFAMFVKFGRG